MQRSIRQTIRFIVTVIALLPFFNSVEERPLGTSGNVALSLRQREKVRGQLFAEIADSKHSFICDGSGCYI